MSTPPGNPARKPVVIAEATQELRAADVVGVLDRIETAGSVSGVSLPRKSLSSQSSIAPVGLELAHGADAGDDDEVIETTSSVVLPARRRRLGKVVAVTLGACAVILVAAGIARIGHASSESSATAASAVGSVAATASAPPAAATAPVAAVATKPSPAAAAAAPPDPASAGTVRLGRSTLVGHVWLDGKKLSAPSVLVSCGTHQVKVGHGRKHSIDVPCGGEISVGH